MNIEIMSEPDKSFDLMQLCGWKVQIRDSNFSGGSPFAIIHDARGEWLGTVNLDECDLNLYDSANMALAWRILNWAWVANLPVAKLTGVIEAGGKHTHLFKCAPADAQRVWLDKILELAIEAGLIEKESATNGQTN